jgi:hypothetical protein
VIDEGVDAPFDIGHRAVASRDGLAHAFEEDQAQVRRVLAGVDGGPNKRSDARPELFRPTMVEGGRVGVPFLRENYEGSGRVY